MVERRAAMDAPLTPIWSHRLPARPALPGDLGEPVPRRRRQTDRCRDQLGDGWIYDGPLFALAPAVTFGDPPLGANGQRVESPVVRRPVVRRVVLEVDGTELRIAERIDLVCEPDGGVLRRGRLHQDPAAPLHLHRARAYAELL